MPRSHLLGIQCRIAKRAVAIFIVMSKPQSVLNTWYLPCRDGASPFVCYFMLPNTAFIPMRLYYANSIDAFDVIALEHQHHTLPVLTQCASSAGELCGISKQSLYSKFMPRQMCFIQTDISSPVISSAPLRLFKCYEDSFTQHICRNHSAVQRCNIANTKAMCSGMPDITNMLWPWSLARQGQGRVVA